MSDLAARLRAIHERVERLVKERDDLRGRSQLRTAAREHQHEAGVLQARITELERENEVLGRRPSRSVASATGSEATDR